MLNPTSIIPQTAGSGTAVTNGAGSLEKLPVLVALKLRNALTGMPDVGLACSAEVIDVIERAKSRSVVGTKLRKSEV